jgi:hypothetical protein
MQLPGRRDEEGQVTPALLIAVIGGFALAVAFVSLQNLLDQSGRAATASDAAALAAGAGHRDAIEDVFAGNSGLHLGLIRQMLEEGSLDPTIAARAEQEAREYADANGAEVRTVTYDGFDLGERQWEYTVLTKQRDTVEGGTTSARSESRSRVAVRVTAGLCGGGLIIGGDCRPWGLLQQLCDLELNPPEPTPTTEPEESEGPSEPADPEPEPEEPEFTPPPGLEGVGCLSGADILGLLDPEIRLIT